MKTFSRLIFLLLPALAAGCSANHDPLPQEEVEDLSSGEALSHEMMVLGSQLDDPYSIRNITKALENLYSTKAASVEIKPTDSYIRFLPKDENDFALLEDLGLDLLDHPLDYKIVREGDYYHDPKLPDDAITWQYTVVPHGFEIPEGIVYEILDDCFIPDNTATKADWVDWEAVEREAFAVSGNQDLLLPATKAGVQPSGRITIQDEEFNGGEPYGLAGVKVVCNVFVKFASAYCNRDGYYTIPKTFSAEPRYRLMFSNSKGFDIGFNLILVPASMSTLGKGPASGVDANITSDSEIKLWRRAVVSNSAYDFIDRCSEDDMDIKLPPRNLRIWLFGLLQDSSTPMLRHGTLLDKTLLGYYLGEYTPLLSLFLPDVTIGARYKDSYKSLYAETVHELAHASHFSQVGKEYWDNYIFYIIESFIEYGADGYGGGTSELAGYCEIGEMWGYFIQNTMLNDRYGGSMPTSGSGFWFHPEILRYLYERGMTRSQLFKALKKDVKSKTDLYYELLYLYPEKASDIESIFKLYED